MRKPTIRGALILAACLFPSLFVAGNVQAKGKYPQKNSEVPMLETSVQIVRREANLYSMTFLFKNLANAGVQVGYKEPFLDFDLEASSQGHKIPIIQPAFDGGVRPMEATIKAGESLTLASPVRLRFDAGASVAKGPWSVWSIKSEPRAVQLRVEPRLQGATVTPAEVSLVPATSDGAEKKR